MKLRYLLLGAGLATLTGATGQLAQAQTPTSTFGLVPASVAKVVLGTDTLTQAWAGGLNTPQFSTIDLNGDGQLDLYAFERETGRSHTFLNVATSSGRRYEYAPDYAALFPTDMYSWVLLRDYNCDGRPDLFTLTSGGIRVFRNVAGPGGYPTFELANPLLTYPLANGYPANINIGTDNMPALGDFNGDGRLDMLSYDFINSNVLELYLNTSTESCGGVSSFTRATTYWGQLVACPDCDQYQLQGAPACVAFRTQHSAGHNVLLLDLNGDGKLDLLDGRDNCATLTRLLNSGSSLANSVLAPAGASSQWPSASAPVNVPVFPAAYHFDADFDGVPDLVIAPNMNDNSLDRVSLRNSVRLYRNGAASASAVPSFALASNFLQQDMLDVSEGAMATFGDLDGDGLTDMLVGNLGDQVNGYYRANLSYYRNVGRAARPVFRLMTADYLGLGAAAQATNTRFEQLRPALVDLNRDGALDLVYSAAGDSLKTHLYYHLNQAAAGQAASFGAVPNGYFSIPGTDRNTGFPDKAGDTPCFFDVDNDGYVDLLLGTNQTTSPPSNTPGSLRYFRNRGAAAGNNVAAMFELANNDYGQLSFGIRRPACVSPTVADFDGDGQPDLVLADASGTVTLYSNFRSLSGNFIGRSDLFYNAVLWQYTTAKLGGGLFMHFAATAADLNRDGQPELYLGTESGGLLSFLTRNRTALATQPAAAAALAFSLYPNPAAQAATAETARPTRLRLLDLTGRQVLADAALARTHQLDLRGLAAGVYIAQATAADGLTTTLRLAVQ